VFEINIKAVKDIKFEAQISRLQKFLKRLISKLVSIAI